MLLRQPGLEVGPALPLLSRQVRQTRRILLPLRVAVDHRVVEDRGIDPIHPATRAQLGTDFDRAIADLRYGAIGINIWAGAAFLLPRAAWGAYPGHTYTDVQSGIGVVHNALMFDKPLKTVVSAPFRPFPRSVRHGEPTLFPKPPWFLTNKTSQATARKLTRFTAAPSPAKLPAIFASALRG